MKIELTAEALETLRRVHDLPPLMAAAIAAAMDAQNQITLAHIGEARMKRNHNRSFPSHEHILGIRTGNYRASLRASKSTVQAGVISSSIGSNVVYAGVHEFGARIRLSNRTVLIPARAPVSTGIEDRMDNYGAALSAACLAAWKTDH